MSYGYGYVVVVVRVEYGVWSMECMEAGVWSCSSRVTNTTYCSTMQGMDLISCNFNLRYPSKVYPM
jgi:hypothetical protein